MKIQLNPHAMAAAATVAGAVFFGSPAYAQQAQPTAPPAQPTAPPSIATPPAPAGATTPTAPPPAGTDPAAAPPPAGPPVVIRPAEPQQKAERRVTAPVIAAGAIGGAGLISGIVFGIMAAGKNSSYKSTPNNDDALDGERSAFISDVSFGIAALFGLTAIALYMLPDQPPPPDAAPGAPPPPKAKAPSTWITSALKGEVLSF